jgi:hypothetical protein
MHEVDTIALVASLLFSANVAMMPGFYLFRAASTLLELVTVGPRARPLDCPSARTSTGTDMLTHASLTDDTAPEPSRVRRYQPNFSSSPKWLALLPPSSRMESPMWK